MRRAGKLVALFVALTASAAVPVGAQARPSLVVTAVAKGYDGGFEHMDVQFECAAVDIAGASAWIERCSFGSLDAPTMGQCMDCPLPDPPAAVAFGSGTVRLGLPHDLCVTATSQPYGTVQRVTRCAPFSYLTKTAVVAG